MKRPTSDEAIKKTAHEGGYQKSAELHFTVFDSINATESNRRLTFAELVECTKAPEQVDKVKATVFIPSDCRHKTKAALLAHDCYTGLVADIDQHRDREKLVAELKTAGIGQFLIYSTVSATQENQRWRVVIPLAQPAPLESWVPLQAHLAAILNGDKCVTNAQQVSFMPNRGEFYDSRHEPGALLDARDPQQPFIAAASARQNEHERVERETADSAARAHDANRKREEAQRAEHRSHVPGQISPIQEYNAQHGGAGGLAKLLAGAGYVKTQQSGKWLAPCSTSGIPGVVILENGKVFSHHSLEADRLADGKAHDAFDLFCLFKCGGDEKAAVQSAAEMCRTPTGETVDAHNKRLYREQRTQQAKQSPGAEQSETKAHAEDKAEPRTRRIKRLCDIPRNPQTAWLIQGFVPAGIVGAVVAPSHAGKSLLMLDWCAHIALGLEWQGKKVWQGAVVYLCGEGGESGLGKRRQAWEIKHGQKLEGAPFYFLDDMPNLLNDGDAAAVIKAIREEVREQVAFVVVDTKAVHMIGGDESSNDDGSAFCRNLARIKQAFGASVFYVAHTGHSEKGRERGASSPFAAIDANFLMQQERGRCILECTKARDWNKPEPLACEVESVDLGYTNTQTGENETAPVLLLSPLRGGFWAGTNGRTTKTAGNKGVELIAKLADRHGDDKDAIRQPFYEECVTSGVCKEGASEDAKRSAFNKAWKAWEQSRPGAT